MEISKSVQEILTQAQMLKLNTNSDTVYVEYILYGLILMARYLDEPMNKKEYLTEAKKLRKLLEKEINSIAMAEHELWDKANNDPSEFHDDPTVLGRAVEIAGNKPVSSIELAKAVLEKSGTAIARLNSLDILPSAAEEDAKYKPKKTEKPAPEPHADEPPARNNDIPLMISGTILDQEQNPGQNGSGLENANERAKLEEERKLLAEERERLKEEQGLLDEERKRIKEDRELFENEKKRFKEEEEILQEEQDRFFEDRKTFTKDRDRLKEEQEKLNKDRESFEEKENRFRNEQLNWKKECDELRDLLEQLEGKKKPKPKQQQKQKPLWTFIGPFEFKGSTFLGFLQYFLLGVIVSCGALFALEHFTHYITEPPTRWWSFGINAFITISVYYHLRGITYLMERKWPAWALFTRQIFDICLILGLMTVYVFEFSVPAHFPTWRQYVTGEFLRLGTGFLPYVPRWLKYVGGFLTLLVFSIGTIIYNSCSYSSAEEKKSITHASYSGPVGKVIFQSISSNLAFPAVLVFSIWAYNKPFKDWHIKVFQIYGFIAVWTLIFVILMCLDSAVRSPWYRGKMKRVCRFVFGFYTYMFVPEMVLYLHRVFGWSPVKHWVMIVLAAYTLICLIGSIVVSGK